MSITLAPVAELTAVSHAYDGNSRALDDVTAEFPAGRMVGLIGLGERHVLVHAVDAAGGGEQKVLRRLGARAFEQVEGADQIGVDIAFGVLQAVADPGLRGEVNDDFGRGFTP